MRLTEIQYIKQKLINEYFNRNQHVDIESINTIEYYVKEEEEYFGDEDEEYDEDLLEKYLVYDIECKNTNYDVVFAEDNMTIEDIEDSLGPEIAKKIANREGYTEDNESYYLTDLLYSISVDDNNVNEVNAAAKRLFSTCDTYYKDCRGYILTDGTILDFGPNTDHISITNVGNQRIASFLQLGNIRIGVQSIDLACEPTFEQKRQLRRMINCYSDEELYVDIVQDKGYQYGQPLTSAKYINPSFDKVYGEISRFFDEGIKLNGGYCGDDLSENEDIYNKKSNMKQKIRLTEGQLNRIIKESVKNVLNENIFDEDYEEIIPLYDIFTNGFTFDNYYREKILLDSSLCYKDGQELGVCLNDLCLKSQPNKKR